MILKRVGILSCGKIMGIIYAVFGVIAGIFFSLFSLIGAAAGIQSDQPAAIFGIIFGVGAIVFFPVLYGLIGFIGGLLSAAVYNVIAGVVGGIELELDSHPAGASRP